MQKSFIYILFGLLLMAVSEPVKAQDNYVSSVWVADNGDGTYKNPILYADYSDPDAIRVGDDYYMTSSSFNCIPGLQILHSKDLVNWTIIHAAIPYALEPYAVPEIPEHGNRIWAPCIRFHKGEFYIFWGDPDQGVFMTKAKDVKGAWTTPVLVKAGKGIIDTSPLWDDDGRVYLAHAYAGSRAGLKSVLAVCELNAGATEAITESRIVFDGHENHETVEGAKFYKKDGKYYIFAPAGGVATGWQLVLRADNPYGPYEEKTVLAQGKTNVNGPHQGAWIDTQTGEDWFLHFQDVGAYGRIVHLQPMVWKNGWPVIGVKEKNGCGEPLLRHKKPNVGKIYPICTPQESDEFSDNKLGLQWQWHANFNPKWIFNDAAKGVARLYSYPLRKEAVSLWDVPNLLLQKTPAGEFAVTMKIRFSPSPKYKGERTGLLVMGRDYGGLILENTEKGITLSQVVCEKADEGGKEKTNASLIIPAGEWMYLRVVFNKQAACQFSYSTDEKTYLPLGTSFQAREGKWIGAKIGTFCTRPAIVTNDGGWADVDWFRITKP